MTADRLDGIGHDGLPRIGSVAIGYVDVVPNWVVRVRPGVVRCLESQGGAKSDAADAHLLAEIVRLDRAHHGRIAGYREIAEHVMIGVHAHQTMIWLRSVLGHSAIESHR
jgi:hypothetical protein